MLAKRKKKKLTNPHIIFSENSLFIEKKGSSGEFLLPCRSIVGGKTEIGL